MRREQRLEYEWLFRAAYPRIVRTVAHITGDRASAEDVTQEAFVKLLQHWRTASHYDQPDAWVRRVAIRQAVRLGNRESRRRGLEFRADRRLTKAPPEAPDADLADAVATLSPMQRAAVVLYYYEDLPVAEIARVLVVSESTVKQHLHRARGRLAVLMGEEVREDAD